MEGSEPCVESRAPCGLGGFSGVWPEKSIGASSWCSGSRMRRALAPIFDTKRPGVPLGAKHSSASVLKMPSGCGDAVISNQSSAVISNQYPQRLEDAEWLRQGEGGERAGSKPWEDYPPGGAVRSGAVAQVVAWGCVQLARRWYANSCSRSAVDV